MIDNKGRFCQVFIVVDPSRYLLWVHVSTCPLKRIQDIEEDCTIVSNRGLIHTIPYQQILELGGVNKFYYTIFDEYPSCLPKYSSFVDYSNRPDIIEFINNLTLIKMHNRTTHKKDSNKVKKPMPAHKDVIKLAKIQSGICA